MKHFQNTDKSKWMIGLATHLCAINHRIKSEQIADESDIKVRLVVNTYGMLILKYRGQVMLMLFNHLYDILLDHQRRDNAT